jgi:hypothetical protein
LIAAELNARAPLGLGASETGRFKIVGAVLYVRAQLLLDLTLQAGAMKKAGS